MSDSEPQPDGDATGFASEFPGEFADVAALNKAVQASVERQNNAPLDDFLGLSPTQMQDLLGLPFDGWDKFVQLQDVVTGEDVPRIPVLARSVFLLGRLRELEPLRTTAKGNLPQMLVREIYARFRDLPPAIDWQPQNEGDWTPIAVLRQLLMMAGVMKRRTGKFSLTRLGGQLVDGEDHAAIYRRLMQTHVSKFNWAYPDRYPDMPIVQQQALFGLYMLRQKARKGASADELGDVFLTAFPFAVHDSEATPYSDERETAKSCFRVRFLDRFAVHFGLLETEGSQDWYTGASTRYRTTELFDRLFRWRI